MRTMVIVTNGNLSAEAWLEAAIEEAPVRGLPRACADCPLRKAGEWEAGTTKALAAMTSEQRDLIEERWGCHTTNRPCAGMRRIAKAAE